MKIDVVQYATSYTQSVGAALVSRHGSDVGNDTLHDLHSRPKGACDPVAQKETCQPVFTATSVLNTGTLRTVKGKTFKCARKSLNREISCVCALELLHDWSPLPISAGENLVSCAGKSIRTISGFFELFCRVEFEICRRGNCFQITNRFFVCSEFLHSQCDFTCTCVAACCFSHMC